jgi:nitroreductase
MTIQPQTILDALNWRYATQIFDMSKPLEEEKTTAILESARLAPSSLGVEPWKFIVVENAEIRAKLKAAGYNQPKISDAPVLVVIAYRTDIKENMTKERMERTMKATGLDAQALDGLKQMLDMSVSGKTQQELEANAKAQAYIPLGIMLETAALLGVDAGPMEGFDANAVDEILSLKSKNLHSTSMVALGYRSADDQAAARPKVRRPFEEVVEFVK